MNLFLRLNLLFPLRRLRVEITITSRNEVDISSRTRSATGGRVSTNTRKWKAQEKQLTKQLKNTESTRDWDDYGDPGSMQNEVFSLKNLSYDDVKAMGSNKKMEERIIKGLNLSKGSGVMNE